MVKTRSPFFSITPMEHDIPTVIPTTKSRDGTKAVTLYGRGKAFHLLPQGALSTFCMNELRVGVGPKQPIDIYGLMFQK